MIGSQWPSVTSCFFPEAHVRQGSLGGVQVDGRLGVNIEISVNEITPVSPGCLNDWIAGVHASWTGRPNSPVILMVRTEVWR